MGLEEGHRRQGPLQTAGDHLQVEVVAEDAGVQRRRAGRGELVAEALEQVVEVLQEEVGLGEREAARDGRHQVHLADVAPVEQPAGAAMRDP